MKKKIFILVSSFQAVKENERFVECLGKEMGFRFAGLTDPITGLRAFRAFRPFLKSRSELIDDGLRLSSELAFGELEASWRRGYPLVGEIKVSADPVKDAPFVWGEFEPVGLVSRIRQSSSVHKLLGKNGLLTGSVITFEAADVVDPPSAYLVSSYREQGFVVSTTKLDPDSRLSGILGLDTTVFPNPGIQSVSQLPGDRVALPEDPVDDIIVQRVDGCSFSFLGGYFSFTNQITQLKSATLTFEGYRVGALVGEYSAAIVSQGGFVPVDMPCEVDKLIIKDNDVNGWAYMDDLRFLV